MPIRLLLACRDKDVALALCANLVQAVSSRIAGEATDMKGVLPTAAATRPDVLLLEHALAEELNSWQMLARLRQVSGSTRFLLLCDTYTHLMIPGFVQRGVDGCLLKGSEPALLAKAVMAVHGGEAWFGRTALLEALRSRIATEPNVALTAEEHELLTQREREILGLIGDALSNKEIARRLKISDNTVKTHLHRIYVKLHQSGRYKAFLSKVALVSSEYPAGYAGPLQ